MLVKKHLLMISTLSMITFFYCNTSWSSSKLSQKQIYPHYNDKSARTTLKRYESAGGGNIEGKVTNTAGSPLSGIPISIQLLTNETIYGSDFEEAATTDKNGKFKITRLAAGNYIVRAGASTDASYLANDKFGVGVKSNKTKKLKLKLSSAAPTDAEYSGNAVCLSCHPDKKDWKDTSHANTILTPTSESVVAPFNGNIITTSDGKVQFKPFIVNNNYYVTLYDLNDETNSVTYSIARTHGGVALVGKQRYQVKIGSSHYILPVQYNNRNVDETHPNDAWVSYNPANWYNSDNTLITTNPSTSPNLSKSFEQNCEGCHVTGLGITRNAKGEFISSSKEMGISCESCHGPGELHVSEGGGNARHIVNPKYLATDRGNEVCGQCHIRVINKSGVNGANFETEYPCIINGEDITPYIPGNVLADYIEETTSDGKSTAGYWNDNNAATLSENASKNNHSQKHHQQYQDLTKSVHYNYAGNKCYTCHEPHDKGVEGTPQLLRSSADNKLCINCHSDLAETTKKDGKTYNKHANHEYSSSDVGGSLCTGCHMPRTAKSAVDNDISSHVFDIIKPYTSKAMADYNTANGKTNNPGTVITNACYGCHTDETDYGVKLWEQWESKN